jgi:hypothetical protein
LEGCGGGGRGIVNRMWKEKVLMFFTNKHKESVLMEKLSASRGKRYNLSRRKKKKK